MNKIIKRTLYFSFVIYTVVGIFGYLTFASNPEVLSNYARGVLLVAYGYPPDGNADDNAINYNFATLSVRF
jgi:hypothetical protein